MNVTVSNMVSWGRSLVAQDCGAHWPALQDHLELILRPGQVAREVALWIPDHGQLDSVECRCIPLPSAAHASE